MLCFPIYMDWYCLLLTEFYAIWLVCCAIHFFSKFIIIELFSYILLLCHMSIISCSHLFSLSSEILTLELFFFLLLSFLFILYCFHSYVRIFGLVWNKAFTIVIVLLLVFLTFAAVLSYLVCSETKLRSSLIISSEKKLLVSLFVDSEWKLFSLLLLPLNITLVIACGLAVLSALH